MRTDISQLNIAAFMVNDGAPAEKEKKTEYEYIRNMVLCEGRHEVPPNDGAVFPREVKNIFDFAALEEIAAQNIPKCSVLRVYVTGLTPCVVAVINVCQARGTELYFLHYDRDEGNYKSQYVDIVPDR